MSDRMAWFWILAEPAAMVLIMIVIRTVILGRNTHIAGAEYIPWFIVGLFGFYLFRENMMRLLNAITANKALFAYRQVKPIDTVLVRSCLESLIRTVVFIIFIVLGGVIGFGLIPEEPIMAIGYWLLLWVLGLGVGLIGSVVSVLVPEIGRVIKIMSFPLLMVSGVLFPINYLPYELQQYLLFNPIVHGIELLRSAFFDSYKVLPNVSVLYLSLWNLSLLLIGLVLHIKFELKLKAK
ncbi:ABC transporter permease [Neptunomonas japonica]|uniref:ABC transporter permease n=1 Tax=Neptunomonas japonica TaxID=417574 RepID=UPI001FE162ED|nr:ABC transporter permease [Neptunomonas japonica]